jgi:hypothetical protein
LMKMPDMPQQAAAEITIKMPESLGETGFMDWGATIASLMIMVPTSYRQYRIDEI